MLRIFLPMSLAAVTLAACSSEESMTLSEAFCSDLRNGLTVVNLWDREQDPADYADSAYGMMAISCPEQLEKNRAYFEQWGINIDAGG